MVPTIVFLGFFRKYHNSYFSKKLWIATFVQLNLTEIESYKKKCMVISPWWEQTKLILPHSLEKSENQKFSDFFSGYTKGPWYEMVNFLVRCRWLSGNTLHCRKTVRIWSFSWSISSRNRVEKGNWKSKAPYWVRLREVMDQEELRIWTLFTQS